MEGPQTPHPIGYGPSRIVGKWDPLYFSGDEKEWELWEERFTCHMRRKKLHKVIDSEDHIEPSKNADAYTELVGYLDNKSVALIMRDAKNDGRKAMKILREHYAGSGKPRIILLYTQLFSVRKSPGEDVTNFMIRAETIASSLKSAGQQIEDGLLIATVLNGLPETFGTFSILVNQSEKVMSFQEFKVSLRNFEENQKAVVGSGAGGDSSDRVLAVTHNNQNNRNNSSRFQSRGPNGGGGHHSNNNQGGITCYKCGKQGHKHDSPVCERNQNGNTNNDKKKYCSFCKSNTHAESNCRKLKKNQQNSVSARMMQERVQEVSNEFHCFHFMVNVGGSTPKCSDNFIVDSGCSAHIVVDDSYFVAYDSDFVPEFHSVELADGKILKSLAEKRGTVQLFLKDSAGNLHEVTLHKVLYIPTFPTNLFSVKAANKNKSSVCFYPEHAELIAPDGTVFDVVTKSDLYFLKIFRGTDPSTRVNVVRDLKTWHSVLGHCNNDDIMKLQSLVDGMKIGSKQDFICEPCILAKQTQTVNREPSQRATKPLEFVSTDLAGPITPTSIEGFEYAISFIDNYSGYIFIYFLQKKSDAAHALSKFLADVSPIGKVSNLLNLVPDAVVHKLRSDSGGEFMGEEFKNILLENNIRHEQCAPYSPHQNGVAERGWRTLFEGARSSLIESNLPKNMWPYALMNAAHIRNRCFQKRTQQTPYFMVT